MTSSRYTPFLLLGIAIALITLQLRLVWNTAYLTGLEPYALCYATVCFLIWRKRNALASECMSWKKLKSTKFQPPKFKPVKFKFVKFQVPRIKPIVANPIVANSVGFTCILWVLYRSTLISSYDSVLRLSPLISGLGLILIGFGFSGLKSYWRELLVLSSLLIPGTTVMEFFDISHATATLSGNLLWYSGFSVIQDGTKLILPTGFVDVYPGCSGLQSMIQLLTLAFLFMMLFPMGWTQTVILSFAAIAVAFLVNGIRVALMAVLVAQANDSAFDYWHIGDGSQLFSMVAVLLFGSVCYFCLEQFDAKVENAQSTEQEGS